MKPFEEESQEAGTEAGSPAAGAVRPSDLLRQDHRKAEELFEAFENADGAEKDRIVDEAIRELKIHSAVEEEIFYPAVRRETHEEELLDEALEEHHVAKLLMREIEALSPGARRDAKFKVLSESVKHHIREEESEMLPKAEEADIQDIAEEMLERKRELQSEGASSPRRRTRSKRSSSGRGRARKRR